MIRRRFAWLAAAAALLFLIFPLTSAEAAEHDLEFTNTTGAINLEGFDPLVIDAGQAGLVGTWDDETGAFTGVTTINPFSIGPPAVPLDIVLRLDPAGAGDNVIGTIDPDTGDALLSASMILTIEVPALEAVCSTPAFEFEFETDPPGVPLEPIPFDPSADYSMTLVSEPFEVPAVVASATCAIADVINQTAGFPADADATLDLVRGTPAPPTTPTTPTTQSTTSTTGATAPAAATSPRFTG